MKRLKTFLIYALIIVAIYFFSDLVIYVAINSTYKSIDNLEQNKQVDFEMWYKFKDVKYATITYTDNVEGATEEQFLSDETKGYLIIGTLIVLFFI